MSNRNEKKERKFSSTPCMETVDGQPDSVNEIVNCYGTYNVQKTNATGNEYPAIAQGISEKTKKQTKKERDEWLRRNGK